MRASGADLAAALSRRSILLLAAAVSACAVRKPRPGAGQWSGRLSLQVRSEPAQSFSAGFELSGGPGRGLLQLNSPLGTGLATARWAPGEAVLQSGSEARLYRSMEELLEQLTGAALPLAALFDWLEGIPTAAQGWQTDLSGAEQGRLRAMRLAPAPEVDLRIVLDR